MKSPGPAAAAAFVLVTLATYVLVEVIASLRNGSLDVIRLNWTGSSQPQAVQEDPKLSALQVLLSTRVCGSPAIDGYAHVDPSCLRNSPTARWWAETKPTPDDLVIHIERRSDYDGIAVAWGIGNKKRSVEECAEACRQHVPNLQDAEGFGALPCNAFVFCTQPVCFEPDAHKHTLGDCWLKFTEGPASPEVNMRGMLSEEQRNRHADSPKVVQWDGGVVLPRGVQLTNGTWSPRYLW